MGQDNNPKSAATTAPQQSNPANNADDGPPSAVVRHLGFIKALSIIMAVLIVAAVSVIVMTIYSRLTASNAAKSIQTNEVAIPADSRVSGASLGAKGEMLLIIEDPAGQQLWQLDAVGEIRRKTLLLHSR